MYMPVHYVWNIETSQAYYYAEVPPPVNILIMSKYPPAVGRGLQVRSFTSPLKAGRGFERAVLMLRNTKQVLGSFATHYIIGFGGTSLAHELFMNTYVIVHSYVHLSSFTGIII
jgi:hypothetical protein